MQHFCTVLGKSLPSCFGDFIPEMLQIFWIADGSPVCSSLHMIPQFFRRILIWDLTGFQNSELLLRNWFRSLLALSHYHAGRYIFPSSSSTDAFTAEEKQQFSTLFCIDAATTMLHSGYSVFWVISCLVLAPNKSRILQKKVLALSPQTICHMGWGDVVKLGLFFYFIRFSQFTPQPDNTTICCHL